MTRDEFGLSDDLSFLACLAQEAEENWAHGLSEGSDSFVFRVVHCCAVGRLDSMLRARVGVARAVGEKVDWRPLWSRSDCSGFTRPDLGFPPHERAPEVRAGVSEGAGLLRLGAELVVCGAPILP